MFTISPYITLIIIIIVITLVADTGDYLSSLALPIMNINNSNNSVLSYKNLSLISISGASPAWNEQMTCGKSLAYVALFLIFNITGLSNAH